MKYLKWYDGEFLGIVGEPTDMTYEDGSKICIGDVITELYSDGYRSKDWAFVTSMGVMGLCHAEFTKGVSDSWKIIKHKKFNEHSETKLDTVSVHTATIHDITVKCATVDELNKTVKLMRKLNGQAPTDEKEEVMLYNHVFIRSDLVDLSMRQCHYLESKIIINYQTFIKHFDDTKLEVEIKQIDNVVLKRLIKGDKTLLGHFSFLTYPLWDSQKFATVEVATSYVEELQSKIDEINNPKLYDSLGQELHEGDDVEYMIKEAFSQGLLSGRLEMFNGKLTIDKFITLPEEIDNTKLYIRKVNN